MRRIISKVFLVLVALGLSLIMLTNIEAKKVEIESYRIKSTMESYDLLSNYFVQEDDKTLVANPTLEEIQAGITISGAKNYELMASNSRLKLYLIKKTLNIAVIVDDEYIFYTNPNRYQFDIEAFFTTGTLSEIKSIIPTSGTYTYKVDDTKTASTSPILTYTNIDKGFKCAFNYDKLGIKYNLYVYLDDLRVVVELPNEEIVEEAYTYTKLVPELDENGNIKKENGKFVYIEETRSFIYLLKSLTFFQNFGSSYMTKDNKWLNGYTFVPDGSGALMRYQNSKIYTTAYVKDVYGKDEGIDNNTSSQSHLKDESILSLPIYGLSHGYRQNAFLNVIEEGDANATLYFTPYGYLNNLYENTYYLFNYRRRYNIEVATASSGFISSANEERYAYNIKYSYNFLTGEEATYSGMAKLYKEKYLDIKDETKEDGSIPLNLNVLAQDYKKGLFGKNFIEMTKYRELLEIVKDLESRGVEDFNISYIGAFRGGFYNNDNLKPRISYNLGSKNDFTSLIDYLSSHNYSLSSYIDPITSFKEGKASIVKKINLSDYEKETKSFLFDEAYQLSYSGISETVNKYLDEYGKFNIDSINFSSVGANLSSYRYKRTNYFRNDSLKILEKELEEVAQNFDIGLSKANSYSYSYLSKYYDMYTESSSYTFISDCVPFISLLLSGNIELYSEEINFIDDYNKYSLRMIEYNIYPTFIITYEDSALLRYTNYEYLYTSEYQRWKNVIASIYEEVNLALKEVKAEKMISHEYLDKGLSITSYSNNKKIIVNYSDSDYLYNSTIIPSHGYEVLS